MKALLTALALCALPLFAHAEEINCPQDPTEIIAMIQKADSCYAASNIAETCAWGSSIDTQIAGAASATCEKDFKKMSSADKKLESAMRKRCTARYEHEQGSMYISFHAFCQLNVSKFWSSIYSEN